MLSRISPVLVPLLLLGVVLAWRLSRGRWRWRDVGLVWLALLAFGLGFFALPRVVAWSLRGFQPSTVVFPVPVVGLVFWSLLGTAWTLLLAAGFRSLRRRSERRARLGARLAAGLFFLSLAGLGWATSGCDAVVAEMAAQAAAAGVTSAPPPQWPSARWPGPEPRCTLHYPFPVIGTWSEAGAGWHMVVHATIYLVLPWGIVPLHTEIWYSA